MPVGTETIETPEVIPVDLLFCRATQVPEPLARNWYTVCKRPLDLLLSLVLLVGAAPVMGLCVMLVRLTSRGPGLYKQSRVGLGGRVYLIYKIRTMYHNCEGDSGPKWSQAGDPRVTPLGRFLRKTHLDELPQLWNVLKGEMSLVGPRPERPEFIPALAQAIPGYRERLNVRPGVTGLAQVQLPPDTDLDSVRRKLVYDLHYAQQLSLGLDLRLLLATAAKVMGLPFRITGTVLCLPSGLVVAKPEMNRSTPASPESQVTRTVEKLSTATTPTRVDAFHTIP